jgi:hypothetical protein
MAASLRRRGLPASAVHRRHRLGKAVASITAAERGGVRDDIVPRRECGLGNEWSEWPDLNRRLVPAQIGLDYRKPASFPPNSESMR